MNRPGVRRFARLRPVSLLTKLDKTMMCDSAKKTAKEASEPPPGADKRNDRNFTFAEGLPLLSSTSVASSGRGFYWRLFAGVTGILVVAISALGLRDPLASMSSYTSALMALNQIAPPLLLLALPGPTRGSRLSRGKASGLIDFLLDPWAATILFIGLSIAVSLPGVFDRSIANALYATPLGVLELGSGLLFWAQFMPTTRSIRQGWLAGTLAWVGAMPMTVVAVVWMLSPDVLYTPYLNVICQWNIPPLVDQRWAGFFMFVAGVPVQLVGVWLLIGSFSIDRAPVCGS